MKTEDMIAHLRAGEKITSPSLDPNYIYYDDSADIVRHSCGYPYEFGFLGLSHGWTIYREHGFYRNLVDNDDTIYYYSNGWARYTFDGNDCDYEGYNAHDLRTDWNWYSCSAPEKPQLILRLEDNENYLDYEVHFDIRRNKK